MLLIISESTPPSPPNPEPDGQNPRGKDETHAAHQDFTMALKVDQLHPRPLSAPKEITQGMVSAKIVWPLLWIQRWVTTGNGDRY